MLGRRGPAQAAFTNPELLELGEMTDADVFVDARDAEVDPLSRAWLDSEAASATGARTWRSWTATPRGPVGKRRRIVLRFLVSPLEMLGAERVEGIRICRNELRDEARVCGRARPRRPRSSTAGSCSARSATAARRSRGCPSTSAAR